MTTEQAARGRSRYLDGAWHRLHPATPLLRGGFAIVVVLTWIVGTLRERLVDLIFNAPGGRGDAIDELQRHNLVFVAIAIVLGVVVIATGLFWISWRASEFQIAGDAVTVRHGVVLRRVRTARLDRIQGVTIGRPLLARILGAARIELDVAGQNANVRLEYLSNGAAEELRRDVLALASGLRRAEAAESGRAPADGDDSADYGEQDAGVRILSISPPRAVGSVLLTESVVVWLLLVFVGVPWLFSVAGGAALVSLVPIVLGGLTVGARRIGRNLRFTIIGTRDGVRIGAGLLSTSNEAVPPGRIHAVRIEQPLLWRPAGWWRVTVNRAGHIGGRRNAELERSIAPVARRSEVLALLPYLIPNLTERMDLLDAGLTGRGGDGDFVPAPRRARWLRPIAWRRTGFAVADGAFLTRGGWFRRHLTLIPQARVQSVALHQGPAARVLRVASVEAHTVHGPVRGRIELDDETRAVALFGELAEAGQHARERDTAHRWGASRVTGATAAPALSRARSEAAE